MRGTKAKELRRTALTLTVRGARFQVRVNNDRQVFTSPMRYLYQALKGRRTIMKWSNHGEA